MFPARIVVFTDADNTLWDTDEVYTVGQLGLLSAVEILTGQKAPAANRLKFVREYDQAIAAKHHKRLRYPPHLLAHAIGLGLHGANPVAASKLVRPGSPEHFVLSSHEAESIGQLFLEAISQRPKLRPGVLIGLRELARQNYSTIVVTEGSKSRCIELLHWYGLGPLVRRVIESPKHPDLYRRICRLGGGADLGIMIGDQIDRDIVPAKEAGLVTVYFPGGFRPMWEPARSNHVYDYMIESFCTVPTIVGRLASEVEANWSENALITS